MLPEKIIVYLLSLNCHHMGMTRYSNSNYMKTFTLIHAPFFCKLAQSVHGLASKNPSVAQAHVNVIKTLLCLQ